MALPADALIEVEEWKEWAEIGLDARKDAILEKLILTAQEQVEKYCRRRFKNEVIVEERHDGTGTAIVRINRPPIVSIQEIKIGNAEPYSEVASSEYTFYADSGIIQLYTYPTLLGQSRRLFWRAFPEGERNILVSYTGGPTSPPEPVRTALMMQVAALWYARGQDPRIASKAFGGVSKAREPLDQSGLPKPVAAMLAPHRKLLVSSVQAPLRHGT